MATSTIVWVVVIAVAVILVGLLVVSMRRRSLAEDHAQAADLRDQADTRAAGLPDLQARVDQADAQAVTARIEAERAEDHATSVRAEAAQQRAMHEDEIRAADRLDPKVDDRADDYSPHVVDPVGPSNVGTGNGSDNGAGAAITHEPTDTSPRDPSMDVEQSSLHDRLGGESPDVESTEGTQTRPHDSGGTHRA